MDTAPVLIRIRGAEGPGSLAGQPGPYRGGVPDAIVADPRVAPVHDVVEGEGDDTARHLARVDEAGVHRIVGVERGLGRLAAPPARIGRGMVVVAHRRSEGCPR